jgi:hypothetical protein
VPGTVTLRFWAKLRRLLKLSLVRAVSVQIHGHRTLRDFRRRRDCRSEICASSNSRGFTGLPAEYLVVLNVTTYSHVHHFHGIRRGIL